jgi:hypothetical protein
MGMDHIGLLCKNKAALEGASTGRLLHGRHITFLLSFTVSNKTRSKWRISCTNLREFGSLRFGGNQRHLTKVPSQLRVR